jgi:hypothetical protein
MSHQDRDRRKLMREQQRQTKALRAIAREQRRAQRQRQKETAQQPEDEA